MSTIDQQFIEYIVKSLVGKPDAVSIDRRVDEKGVLLELTVDPEDLGRVIGKRGATAQSLRTLLRALGTKNEARYNLKIVDNGEPRPAREDRQEDYSNDSHSESSEPMSSDEHNEPDQPSESWSTAAASKKAFDDDEDASDADVSSDKLKKTRAELSEFDDLDI